MRSVAFLIGGVAGLLCGGCAHRLATLAYDVADVPTAAAPAHPVELALVQLRDARPPNEAARGDDRFVYRGAEYVGTVIDDLGLEPMAPVTLAVARHLAKAKVFSRVFVVATPEQAPEGVDLFASGELVRLRGYVEANAPDEESGRDPATRKVVAEVLVADLIFRARPQGPPLARFDVGWSFHDLRPAEPAPPDPWAVAAEALRPALDQLVEGARRATLDGSVRLGEARWTEAAGGPPAAAFTSSAASPAPALAAMSPPGWRFSVTSTRAAPADWAREGPPCVAGRWRSTQEHRFLRRLGPYVPAVELWWCPSETGLEWAGAVDFPARYLGLDGAGRRWFARQVGPSSWPGAPEALAARAGLTPPAERYRFRLGPGAEDARGAEAASPMRPAGARAFPGDE